MDVRTHLAIDPKWSGEPVLLEAGRSRVRLETRPEMAADEHGLVHGGFVFSLADHAAMLAVNAPTVVLGAADVRFLSPSRVGEVLLAEAEVRAEGGRKKTVDVTVRGEGAQKPSFTGSFTCFVPDRHVLESDA